MTIFDILKDVIKEKQGHLTNDPEFTEAFNVYMIARFLSMRKDLVKHAQWLNKNGGTLSKENCYHFLIETVPKNNNYFIKYIKKVKKEK